MNAQIADELFAMANMRFNNFVDVLCYLKEHTTLNSRQLEILIKIDFFEEFGQPNELLKQTELFNAIYGKKQFKKDTINSKLYTLYSKST